MEAARVADAQGEAQNDNLHFRHGVWTLPAAAALPAVHQALFGACNCTALCRVIWLN